MTPATGINAPSEPLPTAVEAFSTAAPKVGPGTQLSLTIRFSSDKKLDSGTYVVTFAEAADAVAGMWVTGVENATKGTTSP